MELPYLFWLGGKASDEAQANNKSERVNVNIDIGFSIILILVRESQKGLYENNDYAGVDLL
jgi:hypothetical protein